MEHVIKVDPKLGVRGGGTKPILFPSPFFFSTSTFPVPKSHLHKHNLEKNAMLTMIPCKMLPTGHVEKYKSWK